MTKEKFVKLISQAKEDKEGRLYINGEYDNKIYGLEKVIIGNV